MFFAFWLLVVYLLVRFVLPRVLRALLGSFVRQQVHKAQQSGFYPPGSSQAGPGNYQAPAGRPAAPGQVRVDYVPPKGQSERPSEFRGGEYVEYEEV